MANYDSIVSGDTASLIVRIVDENRKPLDVSGAIAVTYELAESVGGTALITKTLLDGIVITGSTITVTFGTADTAGLSGDYYHELQITDANNKVFTPIRGTVTIEADLI